jgi:hypothetical protein
VNSDKSYICFQIGTGAFVAAEYNLFHLSSYYHERVKESLPEIYPVLPGFYSTWFLPDSTRNLPDELSTRFLPGRSTRHFIVLFVTCCLIVTKKLSLSIFFTIGFTVLSTRLFLSSFNEFFYSLTDYFCRSSWKTLPSLPE